MVNDPDEPDFLGNDEVEGISSELYDWTFDQVISLGAPAIPDDERTLINWYCPDPLRTIKELRYVATQYDISFSAATQAALPHGYSKATHDFTSIIDVVSHLDGAAVVNGSTEYFEHLVYKPVIGRELRRMAVFTDRTTAEAMGNTAGILGTSRSHLAGACILMSICTADLLPEATKISFSKHISRFSKGISMYQNMATNLI